MRIALFSDVHANLPALEACLKSIDQQAPDTLYCLGDLVGYNIWPAEVIREVRSRRIPTIAGNYDEKIGLLKGESVIPAADGSKKTAGSISVAVTDLAMGAGDREYLRTLPAHIRVEFRLGENRLNLLLVHGSPRKINEYLYEDHDEQLLLEMMEEAGADILCFGHTHKPYHRVLPANPQEGAHFRHAINIGSVGKPKDGDNRGCYVLLTINPNSSTWSRETVQVEFVRFNYDVEQAAKAVEESPLPNEFADMLRKAY
ncbi:metallophosphoesterase family protein [Paraflavisolibacter sp. H34]|uniref:metallophosphoesterase family protein n=1 Tax=Huijunlia imazamoxiresistens TaxID=3127457 RepID=UPI00301A43B9